MPAPRFSLSHSLIVCGGWAALEDIGDYKGAEAAYWRAAGLDATDMDAFCAAVFLSQYLCAWKGIPSYLRLILYKILVINKDTVQVLEVEPLELEPLELEPLELHSANSGTHYN